MKRIINAYFLILLILFCGHFSIKSQIKDKESISNYSGNTTIKYFKTNPDYNFRSNSINAIMSAPVNDNCSSPSPIAALDGTCNGGYTTVGATPDAYTIGCMNGTNNVWFSFVAQGPNVEVTINAGANSQPEVALFAATNLCTGAGYTGIACFSMAGYSNTSVSILNQGVGAISLTVGQTYYVMVTNASTGWPYFATPSSFSICVNNPLPDPAGTDCATASIICSNTSISGNANLWGNEDLTTNAIGSCLGKDGEINSSWYVINVLTGGTLSFTINPSSASNDYDYSVWSGATCTLGAPISCNYSAVLGATGISTSAGGFSNNTGAGGITWNKDLNVVTGGVYIVLVNGYTPNANPFTFNFGGTAILGCTLPPILPISLLYFIGSKNGNNNLLKWSTKSETNNKEFILSKSQNGNNWKDIAFIAGSGTTEETHNYAYKDNSLSNGVNYYKLIQVDYNGNETFLSIIVLDNNWIKFVTLLKTTDVLGRELSMEDNSYIGVIISYWSDGSITKSIKTE